VDQAETLRDIKRRTTGTDSGNLVKGKKEKARNPDIRVIAITSGKGGVGKTNIAANISYALSMRGKKTLLLDADTGLANIDVILGITPKYNLCHILTGEKTVAEAIVKGPGGMMILPASSGIQEITEMSGGQKLTLLDMLEDFDEDLDFMLIDTGAGIAGNVMFFNMCASEIIVVVSPEPTSLTDAYALIKVLYKSHAAKRFMVLVNMSRDASEASAVYRRLSKAVEHFLKLSVEYLGFIPFDESVKQVIKRQHLLMEVFPSSKASVHIAKIAELLSRQKTTTCNPGTIKFFNRAIINNYDR